jgi:hypothetical protein
MQWLVDSDLGLMAKARALLYGHLVLPMIATTQALAISMSVVSRDRPKANGPVETPGLKPEDPERPQSDAFSKTRNTGTPFHSRRQAAVAKRFDHGRRGRQRNVPVSLPQGL